MVSVEAPETIAALAAELKERARRGQGIDTGMIVEAPVLVGLEQDKKARIDGVRPGRQAPGAVAREEGAQHEAVPVGDDDGHDRARGQAAAEKANPSQ